MTTSIGKAATRTGIALNVGAAVAYSTAGLFTRILSLDVWTMLVWRGLFARLFLSAILIATHRGQTWTVVRHLGAAGSIVALAGAAGMVFYIHALRQTSVADVAVIYAASPFVTAILLWGWLGARQDGVTVGASLAALLGVLIMVGGGLGNGHLFGDALALAMTLCMAVTMIAIHRYPQVPMLAAACLSCFLTALCVLPFATPSAITTLDGAKLVLFGVQLGLGQLLLTLGTRLLPATASALIGTLDAPLAPLWVWLSSGEVPSWQTALGGAIVMAGVVTHIVLGERRRPKPAAVVPSGPAEAAMADPAQPMPDPGPSAPGESDLDPMTCRP